MCHQNKPRVNLKVIISKIIFGILCFILIWKRRGYGIKIVLQNYLSDLISFEDLTSVVKALITTFSTLTFLTETKRKRHTLKRKLSFTDQFFLQATPVSFFQLDLVSLERKF